MRLSGTYSCLFLIKSLRCKASSRCNTNIKTSGCRKAASCARRELRASGTTPSKAGRPQRGLATEGRRQETRNSRRETGHATEAQAADVGQSSGRRNSHREVGCREDGHGEVWQRRGVLRHHERRRPAIGGKATKGCDQAARKRRRLAISGKASGDRWQRVWRSVAKRLAIGGKAHRLIRSSSFLILIVRCPIFLLCAPRSSCSSWCSASTPALASSRLCVSASACSTKHTVRSCRCTLSATCSTCCVGAKPCLPATHAEATRAGWPSPM